MEIEFIGHAGFVVQDADCLLVMDPWLSESGAFHSSWFQFPPNHHLADPIASRIKANPVNTFIYISHGHLDHFDASFLARIVAAQPTLLIPAYKYDALYEKASALGFRKILKCSNGKKLKLKNEFCVTVYTDDICLNRDSAILVDDGSHKFLNLNDCKIFDRLAKIKHDQGHIDVFSCQFSGASWHPVSYSYPDQAYAEISRKKKLSKFIAVRNAINTLSPGAYLPAAGPVCFLHPDLFHINLEEENIFPDQNEFLAFLAGKTKKTKLFDLIPGDTFNTTLAYTNKVEQRILNKRDSIKALKRYLNIYSSKSHGRSATVSATISATMEMTTEETIDALEQNLRDKLANFRPRNPPKHIIYYTIMGVSNLTISVDIAKRTVIRSTLPQPDLTEPYYRVDIPSDLVRELILHDMNWEELALSFRLRLTRRPNLYDQLMEIFLIADPNNIGKILLDFESQQHAEDKIIISCGGNKYRIDKYCPHQGTNLKYGWEDGGFWVCPKHRWRFDPDDGHCENADLRITSQRID